MRKAVVNAMGSLVLAAGALVMSASPSGAEPTCSGVFGPEDEIANHGQHVVGDYVLNMEEFGHTKLGWPPDGGEVGSAIAGSGADLPGGPGPAFHFEHGVAPGASFCLDQSQSPGAHPGPGRHSG